jgi:hypothetical protein
MQPSEVRRLIGALEDEVNNGGFDRFFFNSAGNEAAEIIQALEAVGASKTAAIVRRACAKFPGGMPPANWFARQHVLLDTVQLPEDAPTEAFDQEDADFLAYGGDLEGFVAAYSARPD